MGSTFVLNVVDDSGGIDQETDGISLVESELCSQWCWSSLLHCLFQLRVVDAVDENGLRKLIDDDHRISSHVPGNVERVEIILGIEPETIIFRYSCPSLR